MKSRVLYHDIMHCTADGVLGNHLYSGRAVGISEPEDVLMLHPQLRADWDALCAHYQRIGLRHSQQVIWDIDRTRLRDLTEHRLSVFFFGSAEHQVRPDPSWYETVATINCKNAFMTHAQRLGVPVPVTRCFAQVSAIQEDDIAATEFPCYLKAAISVSGVGIFRCTNAAELREACRQFAPDLAVQIQQEVRATTFLNLQYSCEEGAVRRLAATEQVLDGYVHQGNRHPASQAPWELVDPLANWLGERGIRGLFAFDLAVLEAAEGTEYLAIECNPRYNGASYPTLIADKLGIREWLALAFGTRHRRLADLDLSGLEYDPTTGTGVVLVNWGPIQVGKYLALLAGDRTQQEALAAELTTRC
ncbi:peptide ligase PGM1-related protein [Rhabdochromatium marinum]|uniref:peptide ligase PGM1-related protein n=1 Tax=Rhabdochromatium marinum TaxID=48729 RepID=UPI0019036B37|nr:peptide ligase PGM1-related protein [Rhabdochromatium marinum]MBK1648618.1 ATP-grasp domain-containing protein [Rhabdochromatium marinum]